MTLERSCEALCRNILQMTAPPPDLKVSEWADRYRVLSSEFASEVGRWKTATAPYQKDVMDCVTQPGIERITMMFASQTGKSEILNNILGYFIHIDPCPILFIQPTDGVAKDYSKERLSPMFRSCPELKARLSKAKSRDSDNTILSKSFLGGHLALIGANSPSGLASRPIRILLMDEIDRYTSSAGTEGDPRALAEKRTSSFWNRLIIESSTPTIKDLSPIEKEYENGTQEEWTWQCPNCGKWISPKWKDLIWKDKPHPVLKCPECNNEFGEHIWKQQPGKWVAHAEFKGHRSFHLNALSSPIGLGVPWDKLVAEFLKAKHRGVEALKVFVNTRLAETWEDQGDAIEEEILEQRREYYNTEIPSSVCVLTAGVDVQDDRIEAELVGWGIGEESWGIEFARFFGNPEMDSNVWKQLDMWLLKNRETEDGRKIGVACTCIDSGGHCTSEVYKFTRPREQRRVFSIKGRGGRGVPMIGKYSRNNRERAALFTLGVDEIKGLVVTSLKINEEGPNYCHFPRKIEKGYTQEYFRGLTSEKRVTRYSRGVPTVRWEKRSSSVRNEPLDCRVYAIAALKILNPDLKNLGETVKDERSHKRRKVLNKGVRL